MKDHLIVSGKGQITLPVSLRKLLGLGANAIVTAEEQGGRIVLTPAVVVEAVRYTDAQIAAWDKDDTFAPGQRAALARKLKKK